QFAQLKVVWLVSLAEGPTPGTPSTQTDLNNWVQDYNTPFTHVLDPANKNLGLFYDAAALPWNGNFSAKTMEILSSGTGANEEASSILAEVNDYLKQVDDPNGLK